MTDRPAADAHRIACRGFGDIVDAVDDGWDRPSPCPEWTARGVLEHVIGFHEVLLLRPLEISANRPKGDVPGRWTATQAAIFVAIDADPSGAVDLDRLLPALTTDVLVHTWDLATAAGLEPSLDPELCERSLALVERAGAAYRDSAMYDPPVEIAHGASTVDRLLSLLGRDPAWQRA